LDKRIQEDRELYTEDDLQSHLRASTINELILFPDPTEKQREHDPIFIEDKVIIQDGKLLASGKIDNTYVRSISYTVPEQLEKTIQYINEYMILENAKCENGKLVAVDDTTVFGPWCSKRRGLFERGPHFLCNGQQYSICSRGIVFSEDESDIEGKSVPIQRSNLRCQRTDCLGANCPHSFCPCFLFAPNFDDAAAALQNAKELYGSTVEWLQKLKDTQTSVLQQLSKEISWSKRLDASAAETGSVSADNDNIKDEPEWENPTEPPRVIAEEVENEVGGSDFVRQPDGVIDFPQNRLDTHGKLRMEFFALPYEKYDLACWTQIGGLRAGGKAGQKKRQCAQASPLPQQATDCQAGMRKEHQAYCEIALCLFLLNCKGHKAHMSAPGANNMMTTVQRKIIIRITKIGDPEKFTNLEHLEFFTECLEFCTKYDRYDDNEFGILLSEKQYDWRNYTSYNPFIRRPRTTFKRAPTSEAASSGAAPGSTSDSVRADAKDKTDHRWPLENYTNIVEAVTQRTMLGFDLVNTAKSISRILSVQSNSVIEQGLFGLIINIFVKSTTNSTILDFIDNGVSELHTFVTFSSRINPTECGKDHRYIVCFTIITVGFNTLRRNFLIDYGLEVELQREFAKRPPTDSELLRSEEPRSLEKTVTTMKQNVEKRTEMSKMITDSMASTLRSEANLRPLFKIYDDLILPGNAASDPTIRALEIPCPDKCYVTDDEVKAKRTTCINPFCRALVSAYTNVCLVCAASQDDSDAIDEQKSKDKFHKNSFRVTTTHALEWNLAKRTSYYKHVTKDLEIIAIKYLAQEFKYSTDVEIAATYETNTERLAKYEVLPAMRVATAAYSDSVRQAPAVATASSPSSNRPPVVTGLFDSIIRANALRPPTTEKAKPTEEAEATPKASASKGPAPPLWKSMDRGKSRPQNTCGHTEARLRKPNQTTNVYTRSKSNTASSKLLRGVELRLKDGRWYVSKSWLRAGKMSKSWLRARTMSKSRLRARTLACCVR
jgi:hypothetical protein